MDTETCTNCEEPIAHAPVYFDGRPYCCVGCVAVLTRGKRGGHVGIVKDWQGGNPVIVSGNHNGRVGVGVYAAHRLVALRDVR